MCHHFVLERIFEVFENNLSNLIQSFLRDCLYFSRSHFNIVNLSYFLSHFVKMAKTRRLQARSDDCRKTQDRLIRRQAPVARIATQHPEFVNFVNSLKNMHTREKTNALMLRTRMMLAKGDFLPAIYFKISRVPMNRYCVQKCQFCSSPFWNHQPAAMLFGLQFCRRCVLRWLWLISIDFVCQKFIKMHISS